MALGGSTALLPRIYSFPTAPLRSPSKNFISFSRSLLSPPSFQLHSSQPWLLLPRLFSPTSSPKPLKQSGDKISSFSSVKLLAQVEHHLGAAEEEEEEEEKEGRKPPTATEPVVIIAPLPSFPTPELTVKEKKELASYAHSLGKKLKSQQIGKSGVTSSVAAAMVESLESNELLKLKVHGSCPGELSDVIKQLESSTGSTAVSQIGRTLILYRPSPAKMEEDAKRSRMLQQRKKNPVKSVAALSVRRKVQESGAFS